MDDVPLDEQIVQAKLKTEQAKASNAETAAEIADAQAVGLVKQKKLAILRVEHEKGMGNAAYLCGLHEQNKETDREIACLEGKEYRDPDKPDGDWPEPPEPPDDFRRSI